uniref:Putative secreted protein n=1 Tax=Ixodes ricinus TaxID=34613 RepID=A0A6B0V373_IXORI
MLRIFSAVTICTILATQMPSKALSAGLADRLFKFFQDLKEGDVVYTTKASYPQRQSRVDCVMRTKTVSDNTVARLCMQTNINSRRLPPFPMKLSYRRTSNGDVVTEGLSSGPRNTLTIHYVGDTCVVYSVKGLKALAPKGRACGIWRKGFGYHVPNDNECQGKATEACGSVWRTISTYEKCIRVPIPQCKYYQDT